MSDAVLKHSPLLTAQQPKGSKGFTLIELSIVLVIIGLIVGGVLVGQDLIKAAEVRSQIAQIESLNTAVNTFRGKFNGLPGDLSSSVASSFGFTTGTSCDGSAAGKRDGNGLIENSAATSSTNVQGVAGYENGMVWQDLSSSTGGNLISGSVSGITCASATYASASGMGNYFPTAKMGRGMYLTAFSYSGYNWWGLYGFSSITAGATISPTTPIAVIQAYNIDKKADDGYPTTGNIVAAYVSAATYTPAPNAGSASSSTCYDTGSSAYSISTNNGAGSNCGLVFRWQ